MQNTSSYIIQTVAPIFNKKGYTGTTLSDLTSATGLTKGAIYGNFKNKEELAIEAFKYNVRGILQEINSVVNKANRAIDKLYAITNYYRGYYDKAQLMGSCPILSVGNDTKHVNPCLFRLVNHTAKKLEGTIGKIILEGIGNQEFKKNLDVHSIARNIYSMIEGSAFMAITHDDRIYLISMMEHIETFIREKMVQ